MAAANKYTNLSDEELLRSFRKSGDNQWLGYLLQRYTALLFGVALKYLKEKNLAEDAVQQVFLKVLTNMPREEILNFKGWLYVLARNYCLQQLRDQVRTTGDEAISVMLTEEPEGEQARWWQYPAETVMDALNKLGEEQRTSIRLFYLEKNTYEQIMARTGYTFMQVKSYIQNGKRNMKALILKQQDNSRL